MRSQNKEKERKRVSRFLPVTRIASILPFRNCARLWNPAVLGEYLTEASMFAGTETGIITIRPPGGEHGPRMAAAL